MVNPLSEYSIYIEMSTSICTESIFKYNSINATSYCIVREGVSLKQINLHDRKTSNLVSLVLSLIITLLGIVVVGLAASLKNTRMGYIEKLVAILDRKRSRALGEGVNYGEPQVESSISSTTFKGGRG